MIEKYSVGLIIPAHNEEDGILAVLKIIPKEIDRVFVVDNCSTDTT